MKTFFRWVAVLTVGGAALGLVVGLIAYVLIAPTLPSVEALKDMRFQVPLRVYTSDNRLIAEFGEMKRAPLQLEHVPETMIQAILAAEDARYFDHPGVDYQGILRAAINLVRTGERSQGGSTITMQVARNFFLSSEKSYTRKLSEILLALKIERELTKQEILELYINKIYLGHRSYGIGAAAQTYYGRDVGQLSVAQMAMIAGLPKAPSRYNPITNLERALIRRDYVLGRMRSLGYIDDVTYEQARTEPDDAVLHGLSIEAEAPYVAEMVRSAMVERFGDEAYTAGYKVFTTVTSRLQAAANSSVHRGIKDYDQRHGYRGPLLHLDLAVLDDPQELLRALADVEIAGDFVPALVTEVEEKTAMVYLTSGQNIELDWPGIEWASPQIDRNRIGAAPENAGDILAVGDIVALDKTDEGGWRLGQIPEVEGALVSISPEDGAILALVGGFDFFRSKFNRAVQATRQPGSSFKPFIYSAALEKGFTPASVLNDAPVVFEDPGLEAVWRPENYSGKFYGPTRLREALVHSRNLVSIRLLRAIGIGYTVDYVSKFGFSPTILPRDLSLSLGSGSISPLELATGYAVFANGGYRVEPYFIDRIEDMNGNVLMQASPARVCPECEELVAAASEPAAGAQPVAMSEGDLTDPAAIRFAPRVISPQNAYLMTNMMQDVIRRGTGRRARQLGRSDLAGKTGTTNDQRDAWFAGYNSQLVAVTWLGFDQPEPLGTGETGGGAALPMWINYMAQALKGILEKQPQRPPGLVTVRIDAQTGLLAGSSDSETLFETFRSDLVPTRHADAPAAGNGNSSDNSAEHLF